MSIEVMKQSLQLLDDWNAWELGHVSAGHLSRADILQRAWIVMELLRRELGKKEVTA
jgi:hypothetical protein